MQYGVLLHEHLLVNIMTGSSEVLYVVIDLFINFFFFKLRTFIFQFHLFLKK